MSMVSSFSLIAKGWTFFLFTLGLLQTVAVPEGRTKDVHAPLGRAPLSSSAPALTHHVPPQGHAYYANFFLWIDKKKSSLLPYHTRKIKDSCGYRA
ncbi:hypothetical protein TNCT_141991 [Trichonephila clavata]|uniref:Uncharacterized protein n=1 Tax=Trichonephila clavata TaxID=2740835 RepID=A0A8X6KD23_TRICU|nr:hypothetical protein TNCT_141991 [Trichonephila clavata]